MESKQSISLKYENSIKKRTSIIKARFKMIQFNYLEETYKGWQEFIRDKYAVNKLSYLLRIISGVIILMVLVSQYCNLSDYLYNRSVPISSYYVTFFLHKYTFPLFVAWILYNFAIHSISQYFFVWLEIKYKVKLLPLWNTLEDCFELVVSCILILYSINLAAELCNGYGVLTADNKKLYWLIILYFACGFINWVYKKNFNKQYCRNISYTDYFDMNGNRIAQNDKVIYNSKMYNVIYVSDHFWLANENYDRNQISLEEATNNEKAKLMVYKYGMGERR